MYLGNSTGLSLFMIKSTICCNYDPHAHTGSVGLSFLQFCNLNSFRTKFILGFSIFMGISVPQYFNEYTSVAGYGPVHTGARWVCITISISLYLTISFLDRNLKQNFTIFSSSMTSSMWYSLQNRSWPAWSPSSWTTLYIDTTWGRTGGIIGGTSSDHSVETPEAKNSTHCRLISTNTSRRFEYVRSISFNTEISKVSCMYFQSSCAVYNILSCFIFSGLEGTQELKLFIQEVYCFYICYHMLSFV